MIHSCKGGCKYTLVINANPYQATLDLDYGENMMCVKKDCHLPLLHCFRDKNRGSGVYMCEGCNKHSCKNTYCVRCFMTFVTEEEGTHRRQRRSTRKSL